MQHESAKVDSHGGDQNQHKYKLTQAMQKCNKGALQVPDNSTRMQHKPMRGYCFQHELV